MNNEKKEQLVGFLNLVISKITDDDKKEELSKILDKVKADEQLANEDMDYVVQKGYSYAPATLDDDEKRDFIYNLCDEYNDSLSKYNNSSDEDEEENDINLESIRNIVELLIDEVDWENISDDTYKKDDLVDILDKIEDGNLDKEDAAKLFEICNVLLNEGYNISDLISNNIEDYSINNYYNDLKNIIEEKTNENINKEVKEIKKIKAIIEENERLEDKIISDDIEYAVKYLKKKIETDYNAIGDERRISNLKKLESNSIDDINEVITNNGYYKEDLVISFLEKQVEGLESKIGEDKDVKLEITDENKGYFAAELRAILKKNEKNYFKYLPNKDEKVRQMIFNSILDALEEKDPDINFVNSIIKDFTDKKILDSRTDLFLNVYQNRFNSISSKINKIEEFNKLNDTLTKIIGFERLKQQGQSNPKIDEFLNQNNKQEIQEKIRNLKENNKDIDFRNKEYFENLKNEKKVCEDNLEKIKNNSDYLKKQIADKNELIDKLENNKKLKIIANAYYNILDDVVDTLKNDKDFKNSKYKKKFKIIDKTLKQHPDYAILNTYENKDKLINELKNKIAKSLKIKKKKKIKIENNKKKWYKSIAFWGGAALGVGLSFAVVPGTNGLILSGARLAYSLGKKFIKSYAKKHEGKDTRFMRVINKVTDTKDKFKEKHPRITAAVSKVNNFFKKPGVQYFMNGVAVGYTVGKIGQSVANIFDDSLGNGSGTNPSGDTGGNSTPDTPEPTVVDPASDKVADVSGAVDKVAKGQRWDISGVDNGYGFDSSTMDNRVHLNQDLAENVKIVKTKVVDGVKMVLTKSTDGDRFAWFKADDILEQGEVLKAVGRSK